MRDAPFVKAFFPSAPAYDPANPTTETDYDFVYDAGPEHMVQSGSHNSGNIAG